MNSWDKAAARVPGARQELGARSRTSLAPPTERSKIVRRTVAAGLLAAVGVGTVVGGKALNEGVQHRLDEVTGIHAVDFPANDQPHREVVVGDLDSGMGTVSEIATQAFPGEDWRNYRRGIEDQLDDGVLNPGDHLTLPA
ncbi:hypothetical protein KDA23_04925, partial [Candidatus Saccharibacteria bacterium]|nr:hypothetical protein [Candidatus Saccharibacteria bacterium]